MYAWSYAACAPIPIAVAAAVITIDILGKEDDMGENKGKGTKGRNYDELSGVGTSAAGVTGTTGNLNTGGRDGGVGTPDPDDAGNRQSAGHGQPGGTPALGKGGRGGGSGNRQSAQPGGSAGGNLPDDTGTQQRQGPAKPGGQGSGQAG